MVEVNRIDRSQAFARLNHRLVLDPKRMAIITIDVQRGALDPSYATMPIRADQGSRLLQNLRRFMTAARLIRIPIIHVITFFHPIEVARHPFEVATIEQGESFSPHAPSDYQHHKIEGSPGAELMPGLAEEGDYIVTSKRTFDSFYGTNLEILLRNLGVDTVVLSGVNTNTCVMNASFSAYNRGLRVIVLSDCTASSYGDDLHAFALENIARRLGWVLTTDELLSKLGPAESAKLIRT